MKQIAPIDLEILSEQTWSDGELQRDLLRLFLKQTSSLQASLNKQSARTDLTAALHMLKGSAGSLGATQVASLAAEAEVRLRAAPSVEDGALRHALGDLSTALSEACEYAALLLRRP